MLHCKTTHPYTCVKDLLTVKKQLVIQAIITQSSALFGVRRRFNHEVPRLQCKGLVSPSWPLLPTVTSLNT